MNVLLETLPLILAAVVPPLVSSLRLSVLSKVPSRWLPVLIPTAIGFLSGLAGMIGVELDPGALSSSVGDPSFWTDVVQGTMIGSAGVGLHQIKRQTIDKRPTKGSSSGTGLGI